jgi:ParB family chromosome partitioning protein
MLPVEELQPNPFQPRDNAVTTNVVSLAESIRQSGLLQPIVVRRKSGRYEIIAGERRWQAARSIGMREVPTVIRDATDEQMLELALVENIQREDLNAIDRAKAYRQFCIRFGLKPEEIARRLGEDRTTVINYLRMLDLPDAIQTLVAQSKLSMGHARCLLGIPDDAERLRLAESAARNELSVRALEEIVRREKTRRGDAPRNEARVERLRSAHLLDLQRRFEEAVKTKVTIQEGRRKGTGRIVIEYYSLDDFDRIAGMLGVMPE